MSWWRLLWETEWKGILLGRWVIAVILLIGGYFVARLCARLLSRLLYLALGKAREDITREELHRLMRPAWLFPLFLLAAYGAGSIVHFLHLPEKSISWISRVFEALALLAMGLLGSRFLAVLETILAAQYQRAGETYKLQLVHPLFTIGRVVLFLLVGFLMLEHTLKLNVAPFFTTLGLGGLAVALAAQETLQHFIGALAIFADKPFQIGDIIRLDPQTIGTIEKIGLRSTHIRTFDNHLLVIPNKRLADSPLENLSRTPHRRVIFRIGVLYSTPLSVLEQLITELRAALSELPFLAHPPSVYFTNFQDSALEITIIAFVRMDYRESPEAEPPPIFYFQDKIAWTILRTVRRYEKHTGFAFPTRTLHIQSLPQMHAPISEATGDGQ
ncbi:MAG: mechanosensitive ion channel family protein [Bacteroidia bacterium]|nr:mechanosensitive ion channel family protein [Bacteroidia bacterium]MDW8015274.1 mechanosensitive ion channel family protein [Bacteroidia bacterium]